MLNILKHTGILLLAFVFMMTTSGYVIFQHYCSCEEQTEISFLIHEFSCDDEAMASGEASCCTMEQELPACCSNSKEVPASKTSCPADDCCETTDLFYKITTDFTITAAPASPEFIVAFENVINIDFDQSNASSEKTAAQHIFDHPPPNYGRAFLISTHNLKVAPGLV